MKIYLEIIDKDTYINLNIRKNNKLLYMKKQELLEFYKYFYNLIINKNIDISVNISNKKIDFKNAKLINLMDIDSLIECTQYYRGSLIYEYVMLLLDKIEINDKDELFLVMENIVNKILDSSGIKLEATLDDNFNKTILNVLNIEYDDKRKPTDIKKILFNIFEEDNNKTFLVFYDSDLIELDEDSYPNVYYFDISKKNDIELYNINLINDIKDFNYRVLLDEIIKLWPLPVDEKKLKKKFNSYYFDYILKLKHYTLDEDEIILNKILNNLFDINQIIEYDLEIISNNIKSFLAH